MGDRASPPARLTVRGGQGRSLSLKAGDRVTVRDPQGLQAALLLAPADAGLVFETAVEPYLLPEGDVGAQSWSEWADEGMRPFRSITAVPTPSPSPWEGCSLLPADAPPGAEARFLAGADIDCLLVAPGAATTPQDQAVPTDLDVFIDTQGRAQGWGGEPLAPPKADLLIEAASAQAFQVAAGDYVQILDVEGRQCSDFLAFDASALAEGRELGLDPTVTRTLMGHSSPTPGLHAKYFDADLKPLVEIVQDTVGRHDTFLLACTAKYYADAGYPGHGNCSDNFNAALAPHGIAPRKGWPAINFFYNTTATEAGDIVFDEPWSRPGDYVLLRAMTDLVCASSSCADDIDPANGWNPTDIRVRIYDRACNFAPGRATRMTPDAEPRLTRRSAFHERTEALTRNFVEYKGFWAATCFAGEGPIAEYWACRERAVVIDLSALRKFEVMGPDAERLMQLAVTRDIRKLAVGQVVYGAMCHGHGGMIDDGTVFRLGQDNFRWICGDDYCGVWLRELAERHGLKAWVKSSTDHLHNLAVQGPLSREILADLVITPPHQPSLAELKWFRFTIGKIGEAPVVVSRTGYTGELGYEVWCHPKDGPAVWDAIWAAGAPKGMIPMGLSGLDMVRIEAGLVFAAYEFDDQTDPFEAGIGFAAPASKTEPFMGSEALARRRAAPQRRLVGLESDTTEALGHGDPVCVGRARVGVVTSAMRSPLLGRTIALARVDVAHADLGAAVEIGKLDGQQKRIPARVVRFPHYDPDKLRVRA
jgi:aminomethyltransferase